MKLLHHSDVSSISRVLLPVTFVAYLVLLIVAPAEHKLPFQVELDTGGYPLSQLHLECTFKTSNTFENITEIIMYFIVCILIASFSPLFMLDLK